MAKASKTSQRFTKEDMILRGVHFANLNASKKETENQLSEVKKEILDNLSSLAQVDDKGNEIFEETLRDGSTLKISNNVRVSTSLGADCIEVLKKHKLKKYLEVVEIVREDQLKADIEAGKIKDTVIDELFLTKETKVFSVILKK